MFFIEAINKRSLKFKILLLFVLILILPVAILTYLSTSRLTKAAEAEFKSRLAYAGNLFHNTIEDRLDEMKIRVKTAADFDFYALLDSDFSEKNMQTLMQSELGRHGLDYIALIQNKKAVKFFEGAFNEEALVKIAPEACYLPLSSNVYIVDNEPFVVSAAMITKHKSDAPWHILFAKKLPRTFADNLKSLTGAEYTVFYAGKIILTTQIDVYGKRLTKSLDSHPDAVYGKKMIQDRSFIFIREGLTKSQISDAIKLEIALPDSDYNTLKITMRNDFIFFGILGVILALITGSILSWHIAEPIKELAKATTMVADSKELELKALSRKDEIGLLTSNFKAMISAINKEKRQKEQRMKELHALFLISNAVNMSSNSDDLLKYILTHAIEVLGAERGSIMLLDDKTDELMVKVATGGRYRAYSSKSVKLGRGICGTVAKTGDGIICNEGFKDSRFEDFGGVMPVDDIKTLLCSPLKIKNGMIGVINIVNKRNKEVFADSDLSLLNLIASQAAVTIENTKLYELSITDGLTKLYVHRYFQAKLAEELLRARRYGLALSLIMIDIDFFKKFNDKYGHQAGDEVLKHVARTIKDTVRGGIDVACRYGGEEMAVIFPETRAEEAFHTAERLRERIAESFVRYGEKELRVTVSIGVGSYPLHCHDRESLIKAADTALYTSKSSGRNCSSVAPAQSLL